MINDDKILKLKSKILINEFNLILSKDPKYLNKTKIDLPTSITGLIDKQTLPLEEYYNKFNIKLNQSTINEFTRFYSYAFCKQDYFEVSNILSNYFNQNLNYNQNTKISQQDLFYLCLLSHVYTYNKTKQDISKLLLQKKRVVNKDITVPTLNHIVCNFNPTKIAKMIYGFISNLLELNLVVSIDDALERLKIYNKSYIRVTERIVNSHIKFLVDLNNLQLHRNKLFKYVNANEQKLDRLTYQAFPNNIYTNHNVVNLYESKLYPLLNGYFTYPKYKSLLVGTSILDAYWYSDNQLDQLIFEINSLDNQAFYAILKYSTLFINNKDLQAQQETINNFHRVLMPDFGKLDQDKVNIITGLSTLDIEKHPPAHLLLCRSALEKLRINNSQERMLEDILMSKSGNKKTNTKAKTAELWGEFTEYCGKIRCVADTDNFIKWIEGRLDSPKENEELNDWEDFKSIVRGE